MTGFISLATPPKQPPFDAWPISIVLTIEAALRKAYESVESLLGGAHELSMASEDKITEALEKSLIALRKDGNTVSGFSVDAFGLPIRGRNITDYSGEHINRQPDLTFYRAAVEDREDGWFCECKIVDDSHSLHDYLHQGLLRFVDGTYAWAMPQAQMVAYVRCSKTVNDLVSYFSSKPHKASPTHGEAMSLINTPNLIDPNLLSSMHDRSKHSSLGKLSMTQIEARHLWLVT